MANKLGLVLWCLVPALFLSPASGAVLNDGPHGENRVLHGQKLSEHDHYDEEGHEDFDYDHEAFLGEEAHEFDDLDPEESKRRLSIIVDKIDTDGDGFVTLDEMRNWIRFTQDRYMSEDVEKQWAQHNYEGSDEIGWESYRKLVYGFIDGDNEEEAIPEEETQSYKHMEDRDRRRWDMADEDKDGSLTKYEFKHFLHPEEADHMRDVVIQETIEDIDKDGDGMLSVDEYIGDMYHTDSSDSQADEPDWVKRERENFHEVRDKDGDGFMSREEVKAWIIPPDFDHTDAEARHLMQETDADEDERLSKQEILSNYDLFVGSQATDFGEALSRHDEF